MKKITVITLIMISIFCFSGCKMQSENKNPSPTMFATEKPDTIESVATYKKADFGKYNSYASENGLYGDLIYVEGKLSKVISIDGAYGATLTDHNGNKWFFMLGTDDTSFDIEKARVLEDNNIVAMGMYFGYSDVFNMPSFMFYEVKILNTGEEYFNIDFVLDATPTENNDIVLYDQNGIKITYIGVTADDYKMDIKLFIENNTDSNRMFQVREFSINGIMMNPIMSENINAGKTAYTLMTLYKNEIEDLNGEKAEYCEFKIISIKLDDLLDNIKTDTLKIDFNN